MNNYETFKKELADSIKERFAEEGIKIETRIDSISKLNRPEKDFISVMTKGSNVGPNLDLQSLYDGYKETSFDELLSNIIPMLKKAFMDISDINLPGNYDEIKDKLLMVLVGKEQNEKIINDIPHIEFEDMVLVFKCVIDESAEGFRSVTITNKLMEQYGIDIDTLYKDALANSEKNYPLKITGMNALMMQMMPEEYWDMIPMPEEEYMYVASNNKQLWGASVIKYSNFIEEAIKVVGGDFYLLPSSVHECIIIPKADQDLDPAELKNMVTEINAGVVSEEDKLTDSIYEYSSESGELKIVSFEDAAA